MDALAPQVVIAIDPGLGKCGLAAVRFDGAVLRKGIVAAEETAAAVREMLTRYPGAVVVVGDRTGAKVVRAELEAVMSQPIALVPEHGSTLEGRRRYFREHPPRGWRRLLPVSLQTPPGPFDDYVAIILAERYFSRVRGDG